MHRFSSCIAETVANQLLVCWSQLPSRQHVQCGDGAVLLPISQVRVLLTIASVRHTVVSVAQRGWSVSFGSLG